MKSRLKFGFASGVVLLGLLTACAHAPTSGVASSPTATASVAPEKQTSPTQAWQGRLSVTVETQPPRASHASFSLQGHAQKGELRFYSPLGATLAQLQWDEDQVHLHRGSAPEQFASMQALTEQLTGSALPVTAFFDWLAGKPHAVEGWQVDVSRLDQGLLMAQRLTPAPTVTLRIKIDP